MGSSPLEKARSAHTKAPDGSVGRSSVPGPLRGRKLYVVFDRGHVFHLFKRRTVRHGSETLCGLVGGAETTVLNRPFGMDDASICKTCIRVDTDKAEEAVESMQGDKDSG